MKNVTWEKQFPNLDNDHEFKDIGCYEGEEKGKEEEGKDEFTREETPYPRDFEPGLLESSEAEIAGTVEGAIDFSDLAKTCQFYGLQKAMTDFNVWVLEKLREGKEPYPAEVQGKINQLTDFYTREKMNLMMMQMDLRKEIREEQERILEGPEKSDF